MLEEAFGFVLFVLLVDELAACTPPLGDAAEVAPIEPEAVGTAAIHDDAAAPAEDGLGHAFVTHRAFAVTRREVLALGGTQLAELLDIQPDDGADLRFEDEFELTGIEEQAVAGGAALNGHRGLKVELNDIQCGLAARAGHGGVVAQVAVIDLP